MADNYFLFFKSLIKRRYIYFFLLVYSSCLALLLLIISFHISTTNIIDEANNITDFKIIEVANNFDLLANIPHISNTYQVESYKLNVKSPVFETEEMNGTFSLQVPGNSKLNIIKGRALSDDALEMICPINFYPELNKKISVTLIPLSLHQSLNREIPIMYEDEIKGLTKQVNIPLVGIYLNNSFFNDKAVCYINYKNMQEITNNIYNVETNNLIIEVDDLKNMENLEKELLKNNISYKKLMDFDLDNYEYLISVNTLLFIIFNVIITIVIAVISSMLFNLVYEDYLLYYRLGYPKQYIIKLFLLSNLTIWFLTINLAFLFIRVHQDIDYNFYYPYIFVTENFYRDDLMIANVYIILLTLLITLICSLVNVIKLKRRTI